MKNIKVKCKINITTYIFFLISFLCGYFKNILFIFCIVFIHEMGHVFLIKIFKYKIVKVEFYPFGGITEVDKPINSSINKELFISLGGIFFQLLFYIIIFLCFKKNGISFENYSLLSFYNKTIMIFNLLPMIPLDGSVFLHAFLEKLFPYQKSFQIYQLGSLCVLLLFVLYILFFFFDIYFICIVLFIQLLLVQKRKKYYVHRFYLERFLYSFPYKKKKKKKNEDISVLKKETRHFFYEKTHYITEKEKIIEYFKKGRESEFLPKIKKPTDKKILR